MQFNKKTIKKKYISDLRLLSKQILVIILILNKYQPKGNAEIDLKAFFGAENYKIIKRLFKENMKELGY